MKVPFGLQCWMVWRHLKFGKKFFSLSVVLSIIGMMCGVAALVVAMAIVSGYESTLRNSIIDSFGHLNITRGEESFDNTLELINSIKASSPAIEALTPHLLVAGIVTQSGRVKGVLMEGIEMLTHQKVLKLERHLFKGKLDVSGDPVMGAVVGKGIAKELGLNLDDVIKVVTPVGVQGTGQGFRSKIFRLKINGIIDLGRHDFDERYILVDLNTLQEVTGLTQRITGYRIKIDNFLSADQVASLIEAKVGEPYRVLTWWDSSRAIFKAIEYEKPVIFFIVLLITVAAVFNISAALFVSVFRRYREISILRAVGAKRWFIMAIFTTQGMVIGLMGSSLGVILGLMLCKLLIWLQNVYQLFPGDVYRIDRVVLEVRSLDLVFIILASMVICFLATLAPSLRGARLKVVEGLRYE